MPPCFGTSLLTAQYHRLIKLSPALTLVWFVTGVLLAIQRGPHCREASPSVLALTAITLLVIYIRFVIQLILAVTLFSSAHIPLAADSPRLAHPNNSRSKTYRHTSHRQALASRGGPDPPGPLHTPTSRRRHYRSRQTHAQSYLLPARASEATLSRREEEETLHRVQADPHACAATSTLRGGRRRTRDRAAQHRRDQHARARELVGRDVGPRAVPARAPPGEQGDVHDLPVRVRGAAQARGHRRRRCAGRAAHGERRWGRRGARNGVRAAALPSRGPAPGDDRGGAGGAAARGGRADGGDIARRGGRGRSAAAAAPELWARVPRKSVHSATPGDGC